jgi:hypothetical protein
VCGSTGRVRCLDVAPRRLGPAHFERGGHDFEASVMEFVTERLPIWQIRPRVSPIPKPYVCTAFRRFDCHRRFFVGSPRGHLLV